MEKIQEFLAVTKVYDPAILRIAACFAIVLGLIGKFGVILQTIPQPVMGGVFYHIIWYDSSCWSKNNS